MTTEQQERIGGTPQQKLEEPTFQLVDYDTATEECRNDLLIAMGALTATGNPLLQRVAIGIHNAMPMLAALMIVGRDHQPEIEALMLQMRENAG